MPLQLRKDSRLLFPVDRSHRRPDKRDRHRYRRPRRASHLRAQFLQAHRRQPLRYQHGHLLRPLHKAPHRLPLRLHKDSRLLFRVDRSRRRLLCKRDHNRYRQPRRASHLRAQFLQSRRRPPLRYQRGHLLRLLYKVHRKLPLRLHKDSRPLRKRNRNRYRLPHKAGLCRHRRLVSRRIRRPHRYCDLACRHPPHSRRDRSHPRRQEPVFRRNQRRVSRCGGWRSCAENAVNPPKADGR